MLRPRFLDDIEFKGRTVLLRGDLNVPMDGDRVTDPTRIERLIPTIRELTATGAKVVLLSHFGRPRKAPAPEYSLARVRKALEAALGAPVAFASDCVGPVAEGVVRDLPAGGVALMENTRFHAGEEANDQAFAARLARLGDVFVNDAFSAAHRAHASTEALARLLPSAAGRLMQAELEALGRALDHPERPVAAIVGGAKISTKLDLLLNLVHRVDVLILGGGMANTFLAAAGVFVGASLQEADMHERARAITTQAEAGGCRLVLPVDAMIAPKLQPGIAAEPCDVGSIPDGQAILDIGPATVALIGRVLADCRTVVWNGPLGAFEVPPFDKGTLGVARLVAELTRTRGVISVAGGGDTVAALSLAGLSDHLTYVSTAGGAFLEWMEGRELPGVAALIDSAGGRS